MLLRIAIVDDLPQDAERLQQALTAEGQTYLMAADGQRMSGPLGGTLPESFLTQRSSWMEGNGIRCNC